MIHFHNLTLGYDRHPVIHHLHGEVAAGSLLAVIGPNGGGKSTLLKGILGQLAPLGGEIQLGVAREEIGYLPQQSRIDRQFPITVREVVAMGLWRHCGLFGRLAHSQRARVDAALERVGLENMAESRLEALSGGQLQRAGIARVLYQQPDGYSGDEPVSALDPALALATVRLLVQDARARNCTLVTSLHAVDLALECFDRIVGIRAGEVLFDLPAAQVTQQHLHELYASEGQALPHLQAPEADSVHAFQAAVTVPECH